MEALLSHDWREWVMASKYDQETRERVVRLFRERRLEAPEESLRASYRRINELVGIPLDTMRAWVTRAEIEAGERAGVTSSEHEELKRLRRENAELKRANEILKRSEERRVGKECRNPGPSKGST